jgi:hypothetical protein
MYQKKEWLSIYAEILKRSGVWPDENYCINNVHGLFLNKHYGGSHLCLPYSTFPQLSEIGVIITH